MQRLPSGCRARAGFVGDADVCQVFFYTWYCCAGVHSGLTNILVDGGAWAYSIIDAIWTGRIWGVGDGGCFFVR